MGVESKPGSLWFYCTLLCNWSRKSRHSLDQSDARIKTIATRSIAFSRAKQFEFSLANDNVYLCSDWLLGSSFFTALKYYHNNKLTNRISKLLREYCRIPLNCFSMLSDFSKIFPQNKKTTSSESWGQTRCYQIKEVNPLTPKRNKLLNSPYMITPKSNTKVARMREIITNY